jgi:hypothetical protein
MINKVPTTRERYLALVEAIGTQHKAGVKAATDDLDRLGELIGPAFGFYHTSRYKAARMITESLPAGEARDDRLQKLEEERAGQEITAADARKEMNELAQKYGTPDVFLADTSSEILSAELVSQFFSQR